MENLIEIVSVPVIAAVVYGILVGYKKLVCKREDKEKFLKIIPILAAGLGVIFGIISFYALPWIVAADNIFTAILVGGASGLAATGCNQIFKQLLKKPEDLLKLIAKKDESKEGGKDDAGSTKQ